MKPILSFNKKKRNLLNFFLFFISLFIFIIITGYIYEIISLNRGLTKYPPPGDFVEVDGQKIHVNSTGENDVNVVILTGSGSFSADWMKIQKEVSNFARVITYDRPGYGWSSEHKTSRTSDQVVKELDSILSAKNVKGPIILVGHSLGGLYAQYYQDKHPDQVSGMILVDSRPPEFSNILPLVSKEMDKMASSQTNMGMLLSRIGVVRLLTNSMTPDYVPEEIRDIRNAIGYQSKVFKAMEDEAKYIQDLESKVSDLPPIGDLPLTVISHGKEVFFLDPDDLDGEVKNEAEQVPQVWNELQEKTANRSSNSSLLIAKNSGHDIMLEEPEIVVESIRNMVELIQ